MCRARLYRWSVGIVLLLMLAGCSKDKATSGTPTGGGQTETQPLVYLPLNWKIQTALMSGFPAGIEIYRNTTPMNGKAMNAYCVVYDPANVQLEWKPVLATTNKKPSQFFTEETGTPLVSMNAGYFGTNVSYSLVMHLGDIKAQNIKSLTRTYNGTPTNYYPTRAAFGISNTGQPDVAWIYHVGTGNGVVYKYPQPSPNVANQAPQPVPTASFPQGGQPWQVLNALGGSPVLVTNSVVNVTDTEEMIDINNTTSRARTAIGYTNNGKVIMLAVEGNNASGGAGLNLVELAQMMRDMGCNSAINLDGGGSTCLIVKGQQTVKPSDAGGERAVMSAIIIKKK